MVIDWSVVPNWFMSFAVIGLCAYTAWSLKEKNDDFKKFFEELFDRTRDHETRLSHLEGEHNGWKSGHDIERRKSSRS